MPLVPVLLASLFFSPAAPQTKKKAAAPVTATEKGKAKPPPTATIEGAGELDAPRKLAEAYLRALEGKGNDDARNYLLGGLTLTAQDFSIPNWRITKRDAPRIEEKDVAGAVSMMRDLEKKGAEMLNTVVVAEDSSMALTQEQAHKMLEPTRIQAAKFIEAYPLFAYTARVGKDVFWHPENPWHKEIKRIGREGNYKLEVHRFVIEEKDGAKVGRIWPLRVLRIQANGYDSGWKILPASDWDPNY
jgi:hypothetical protein